MADRMPKELLEHFKKKQNDGADEKQSAEDLDDSKKEALRKARKAKLMRREEKQKSGR